jgi:3-oxoacyl-[acyl-carrier protein] reductase
MKKNVLISGSTRGLGLACAKYLSSSFDVILTDISEEAYAVYDESESLDKIIKELVDLGSKTKFYSTDLTIESQTEKLVREIQNDYGQIDSLINCAGGDIYGNDKRAAGGKHPVNDALINHDDFFNIFDRNFTTCFNLSKSVATLMKTRKKGKIVNVSSVSAGFGGLKETAYSTGKSAIIHYTRCLASQLRSYGINVNCVVPGGTNTGRFMKTLKDRNDHDLSRLDSKSKLSRLAEPIDIARVIKFFLSDDSDFISGQVIRVDGGQFTSPI